MKKESRNRKRIFSESMKEKEEFHENEAACQEDEVT
jgi:hypothetical protein